MPDDRFRYFELGSLLVLMLIVGLVTTISCSSADDDDDQDETDDDDDQVPDDDDDNVDDDDDDLIEVRGIVQNGMNLDPMALAAVELIDDATGLPFPEPITGETDANGEFELSVSADIEFVGIRTGENDYLDSYLYHVEVNEETQTNIYLVSEEWIQSTAASAGLSPDHGKGHVIGQVLWAPQSRTVELVGCAQVETNPTMDNIFFVDDAGEVSLTRNNTNPNNGVFLIFNINPDSYSLTATVDSQNASATIPYIFPHSVTYSDIQFSAPDTPENPTPAGCI